MDQKPGMDPKVLAEALLIVAVLWFLVGVLLTFIFDPFSWWGWAS